MTATINGVDRDRLAETVQAIGDDPNIARFQFRLNNRWEDGGWNKSTVAGYRWNGQEMRHAAPFELANDEPEVLLSGDRAPNPVENVLHALAGCLTTSLVYHAAAKGIPVRAVSTRFEGDLDLRGFLGLSDDVRRGFDSIRVVFDIDADLDDEGKRGLIETAQRYSPVYDMLTHGVPVRCDLEGAPRLHA